MRSIGGHYGVFNAAICHSVPLFLSLNLLTRLKVSLLLSPLVAEMDRGLVSLVSNSSSSSNQSSDNSTHSDSRSPNKSLSPMSGALPPTFSRLPPDGHEFPPNFAEPHPQTTSSSTSSPEMPATTNNQVPLIKSSASKVVEATMKIR